MEHLIDVLNNKGLESFLEECNATNYKQECLENMELLSSIILHNAGFDTSENLEYAHLFKRLYSIDKTLTISEQNIKLAYEKQYLDLAKFMIENGGRFSCGTSVTLSTTPTPTPCTPVENKYILVTGGTGYIGSHTIVELLKQGHNIVTVDNFSNSCSESLKRVEALTGKSVILYNINIKDKKSLDQVFQKHPIWAVIHFAGYKSVNESIQDPLKYYDNNVNGTIILLECMIKNSCYNIVFSSSATVYGHPETLPIPESHPLNPINPYGRSKLMAEQVIQDTCIAHPKMNAALLRYFNPIGAHESGMIGEHPSGIPNNLLPYVSQTLAGKRPHLNVYGYDYPTSDNTGVRDYIHVVDLALGHCSALEYIHKTNAHSVIFNMGTGTGYSVLQVVNSMECASDKKVKVKLVDRRPGDAAEVIADASKANEYLKWYATRDIQTMCKDAWKWQKQNPDGYD